MGGGIQGSSYLSKRFSQINSVSKPLAWLGLGIIR